jgi:hypothetical protein
MRVLPCCCEARVNPGSVWAQMADEIWLPDDVCECNRVSVMKKVGAYLAEGELEDSDAQKFMDPLSFLPRFPLGSSRVRCSINFDPQLQTLTSVPL